MNESRLIKQQITTLWISKTHAKLFLISEEKMQKESFYYIDPSPDNQVSFFDRILQKIPMKSLLILLGPGVTKDEFLQLLQTQWPQLAKQVITCEVLESDSEIEIANRAYKYLNLPFKNATNRTIG